MLQVTLYEEEAETLRALVKMEQKKIRQFIREQSRTKDEEEIIDIVRYNDMLGDMFEALTVCVEDGEYTVCEEVTPAELTLTIADEITDYCDIYQKEFSQDECIALATYIANMLVGEFSVIKDSDENEELENDEV